MGNIKEKIPQTHKKAWITGGFGGAIGGGIGGYISSIKGNYIYAGIGAAVGYLIGIMIGSITRNKTDLISLATSEKVVHFVIGVVSLAMVIAGVIAFISSHKLIHAVGVLFFGACGIYLLTKKN